MSSTAAWQRPSESRGLLPVLLGLVGCACTGPNPEYLMTKCNQAERYCVDDGPRSYPVVCKPNKAGSLGLEREACPQAADCKNGLCVPPAAARSCTRHQDCEKGSVCVPLVNSENKALETFCLPAGTGELQAGEKCEKHEDCKSYQCWPHGNKNYCVKPCREQQSSDCGIPNECVKLDLRITDVPGVVWSCRPFLG